VHQRITQEGKEVNPLLSCETGNLVVKVNMMENVEEGPMMANTELLEAWISSGREKLVCDKANQVTRVSQTCSSYPKLSGSNKDYLKVILA
jgi:hypothetical protein